MVKTIKAANNSVENLRYSWL